MGQPIDTASVLIVPEMSGFARQLKSEIDAALRQVQASMDRAFSSIERDAAQSGAAVGRDFQVGGERAEDAFRELSRTARVQLAEVNASATSSGLVISSRLGEALAFVKTALLGVGVAAGAGLVAMTGFGLKSAASLEQSTVAFTSLLHSAQDATSFLAELQQFAAATPFEFKDVVPAAQRILVLAQALGQTKDAVVPLLTTIGDLVSVTGGSAENINSVVRALSQMASKGKVSQEEIMQLAEALPGFNANAAIASSLGLSVADTLDLITSGGVDATTGINALIQGMKQFPGAAGAMAAQAQTLTGVFSTFKDTIGIALTNAFQPVIPDIKNALAELTPILGNAIGQLAPSLGGALSKLLPIVGRLVEAIVPILMPLLDSLGPVLDALEPSLVPLGEALGELVTALVPVLPILAQFIAVLAELAIPTIRYTAGVLSLLTPILDYMARAIAEVAKALRLVDWGDLANSIGGAFSDAWNQVYEFFRRVVVGWQDFDKMILEKLIEFRQSIIDRFNEVVAFITGFPGRLLDAIGDLGGLLLDAGRNLVAGLWNGISGAAGWLWGRISAFVRDNVVGAFRNALGIGSPSKVMADQVGEMIPAGAMVGVERGLPDLQRLISGIVPGANGTQSGAPAMNFGGINVTINFVGGTPTTAEATAVGQAAGDGIMKALARRNVGLAVSMGVSH